MWSPLLRFLAVPGRAAVLLRSLAACVLAAAAWVDVRAGTFAGPASQARLALSAAVVGAVLVALPLLKEARSYAYAGGAAATASLVCSVALLLSHPAAGAASAYGAFEPVALLLVLAFVARRGPAAPTAPIALLLAAAVVLRPLSIGVREGSLTVAFGLTLVAFLVAGASVTARIVEADRRQRAHRVRLEQRIELARDLHDHLAQHVTGIVVQAQGARAVAARRPDLVLPALQRIEETGAEALASMRQMVAGLRAGESDAPPAAPGCMDDLRALVQGFALNGVPAYLTEEGPTDTVPPEVAATLHRVTMESLANIRKHARHCRHVSVHVRVRPHEATVRITNDGTARPASRPGYGLKVLRERVTLAGGTFRAEATAEGDWQVRARMPLTTDTI
ncbi:sensor histidine kinase [Streptomyces xanthophaeus]|uniref:sensor histidine kinase n=1 Tax=Streptomyces xanthophaeus TaxID=67385 RepID=UPI00264A49F2|nr:histidine kinase [Streptomyces xanthophaeus]WKD30615.1 histidine kinase [Streptomyces xanthophaeus]